MKFEVYVILWCVKKSLYVIMAHQRNRKNIDKKTFKLRFHLSFLTNNKKLCYFTNSKLIGMPLKDSEVFTEVFWN